MQTIAQTIPPCVITFIEKLRTELRDPEFLNRHRVRPQDFTRHCQLTFPVLLLFLLQKTAKSIQRHVNQFLKELGGEEFFEPVSTGAVTHARAKLKHTAFIELNHEVVVPSIYGEQPLKEIKLWHDHRVLAIDGSKLRLPNHPELFEQFTSMPINYTPSIATTMYPEARISVLYDLLNRVSLDGQLRPSSQGEVGLAVEQLDQARLHDVIVTDRGYTGFPYLSAVVYMGLDFISRCSTGSFAAAQELFRKDEAGCSIITKIKASSKHRQHLLDCGRELELTVRFISLRLPSGELEVLVTSLIDEQKYPTEEFMKVYNWRWNEETFFYLVKSRLDLENFSGYTAEAVRQDFYSTLLLSNIESVLIEPTSSTLKEESKDLKYPQVVNHAVSYHAIKHRVIDLLYSDTPALKIVTELQILFRTAPVSCRKDRKVPRPKPSVHRSYHFQKCVKKITF